MKTIYLDKNGDLYLEDTFNGTQDKVDTIKYYLDCPLRLDVGVRFESLFNHIIMEYKLMDIIFSETMGPHNLESFIEEWEKPFNTTNNGLDIDFIRFRKVLEYIEIDKNNGFVDIRVDLDGVGENNGVDYSLEFMSLTEMKKYPITIDNIIHVKENLINNDKEVSYIGGDCIISLFEVIGTLLYEITCYGAPNERDIAKQKLIETIDNKNLINVLELQMDEAVRVENYEEAANIRNLIDKYKQIGK